MDKSNKRVEAASIYLASSNFPHLNEQQPEWIEKALDALNKNDTVLTIHNPWTNQYKDLLVSLDNQPIDNGVDNFEWAQKTFNADVNAVSKSTVGVFLIDVNNLDMGLFIEMGILVSQNKPIIAVMLDSEGTFNNDYAGNLMLTQAGTYFTKDISDLEHYDFNRTPGNSFNDLGDNFIVI